MVGEACESRPTGVRHRRQVGETAMRQLIAKSGLCILGIVSALSGTSAAQGRGTLRGDGPVPASLTQMIDQVDLIAEVVVESVFPPAAQRQQAVPGGQVVMHRDALLRVTRILKGSESSSHIVWAGEFGSPLGDQNRSPYPLLQVGRSLLVFAPRKAPQALVDRREKCAPV